MSGISPARVRPDVSCQVAFASSATSEGAGVRPVVPQPARTRTRASHARMEPRRRTAPSGCSEISLDEPSRADRGRPSARQHTNRRTGDLEALEGRVVAGVTEVRLADRALHTGIPEDDVGV